MSEWISSPERAHYAARHEPYDPRAAPYYLRCDYFKDGRQCRFSEGHPGEHLELKEKQP